MQNNKRRRWVLAIVLLSVLLVGVPAETVLASDLDADLFASVKEQANAAADDYDDDDDDVMEAEEVQKSSPEDKYKDEIDGINSKLNELQEQKKIIQQNINETKSAKEQELANKNYLDEQIYLTKNEISLLMERIAVLEDSIAQKEEEIELKQAEIDANYEQFKTRLRALQVNDDATTLGLILGADSFGDFLSRTEVVGRIAEHDRTLMQNLAEQREDLELAKAELHEHKQQIEADREETEQVKQTLNTQLNAAAVAVQNLEQMEREYLADLEKNQAQSKAMEKELEDIYRRIEWDKNPYVGGEMAWPVPGFYKVSSPYGWRFGGSDFHTGMDITGTNVYGNAIVAANAGTVKLVNWTYTQGRGYGIYVIVDHGGGTTTLYGHCSNVVVSVGDKVAKGQKIAEVGSTGWSTGPHLHFEVRLNGGHTNPAPYVTGK